MLAYFRGGCKKMKRTLFHHLQEVPINLVVIPLPGDKDEQNMTVFDPIDKSVLSGADTIVVGKSPERVGRTGIRVGCDLLDLSGDLSCVLFRNILKKIPHATGKLDTKHVARAKR